MMLGLLQLLLLARLQPAVAAVWWWQVAVRHGCGCDGEAQAQRHLTLIRYLAAAAAAAAKRQAGRLGQHL
jgi:hypothetical protein